MINVSLFNISYLDPREAGGHYYSLFICLFQYFIPVLVMGFCYAMVANTMWRSRNTLSGRENSKRFISSNKTQTQHQQNSFRYEDSARKQSMTRGGQKVSGWNQRDLGSLKMQILLYSLIHIPFYYFTDDKDADCCGGVFFHLLVSAWSILGP